MVIIWAKLGWTVLLLTFPVIAQWLQSAGRLAEGWAQLTQHRSLARSFSLFPRHLPPYVLLGILPLYMASPCSLSSRGAKLL